MSVLYTFDAEGNVAQGTDGSANVLSDHLFDGHGSNLNGSLSEPFGYKAQFGYYTDNETCLQGYPLGITRHLKTKSPSLSTENMPSTTVRKPPELSS